MKYDPTREQAIGILAAYLDTWKFGSVKDFKGVYIRNIRDADGRLRREVRFTVVDDDSGNTLAYLIALMEAVGVRYRVRGPYAFEDHPPHTDLAVENKEGFEFFRNEVRRVMQNQRRKEAFNYVDKQKEAA